MPDFRQSLYENYVSKFKDHEPFSAQEEHSYLAACRYLFRPILKEITPESKILDLGCGKGTFLVFLQAMGFTQLEGVDISSEQVELAKQRGLNVSQGDAFEFLANHAQHYDAIFALDFIEHFSRDELPRLANHLAKALKPGGQLVLQTPNGAGLFPAQVMYGDLSHMTIFSPGSLRQLLGIAGFEQFRFYETGPVVGSWKGTVRKILWDSIKMAANLARFIETGKQQDLWTENMICQCRLAGTDTE